jgi:pimeloyl-ACP methyl ester carboxylesterase
MSAQVPAPASNASAPPAIVRTQCPGGGAHDVCGFLPLALDRRLPDGRRIRIYFELRSRADRSRPPVSTVLSIEGGPGFSTTADRSARVELWRPISARRDLLLVDLRGTGRSDPLDCAAFRRHILGYVDRAARCAAQLGAARDFYDTSQSVQDLKAVLHALRISKVDLYGDSYGSYVAQAFALRYPRMLRSLVLDGTYQLPGTDPAWADIAASTRSSLRLACGRRPGCPAGHGDPVRVVARLVAQVRRHPITGTAPDGDGTPTRVRIDEDALVQVLMSGYYDQAVWRDILAAARSAAAGDTRPLLRLAAETRTTDRPNGDPRFWSESLYLAVICNDYPELWASGTPVGARPAMVRAALAGYPPGAFAPFSAAAWTGTDYESALACLKWPSRARTDPPAPPGARYPRVPTLILNGDLDNITPLSDAAVVARRFPRSTLVDVENSGHVTALLDQNDCASVIYEHFVSTRSAGDVSCASRTPEVRVVTAFARSAAAVAPARAGRRDRASLLDRRVAAAAAETVADALQRWWVNYDGTGVGLRGGSWSYSGGDLTTFVLKRDSFVPGVAVSGTVRWVYSTGRVRAEVTVRSGGLVERLHMRWSLQARAATAGIDGTAAGRPLHAHMLAP